MGQLLEFERILSTKYAKELNPPLSADSTSKCGQNLRKIFSKNTPSFNRSISESPTLETQTPVPLCEIYNRPNSLNFNESASTLNRCSCVGIKRNYTATDFRYNKLSFVPKLCKFDVADQFLNVSDNKSPLSDTIPYTAMTKMNLSRQNTVFYTPDVEMMEAFEKICQPPESNLRQKSVISPSGFFTAGAECYCTPFDEEIKEFSRFKNVSIGQQSSSHPELVSIDQKSNKTWPVTGKKKIFEKSISCCGDKDAKNLLDQIDLVKIVGANDKYVEITVP